MTQSQDIAKRGVARLVALKNLRDFGDHLSDFELECVIDALTLLEPVAAGTHIIVPVEPGLEMRLAGFWLHPDNLGGTPSAADLEPVAKIYRAMISAASSKPEGREG